MGDQHVTVQMEECIRTCLDCHRICLETANKPTLRTCDS